MLANQVSQDVAESLTRLWEAQAHSGATSDMVYAALREAILSRALPPGHKLGEESLAALFKVSRTPIREALVRLEAEGFAHRVPRRGLIVGRLTPQEIIEVYVVRETIDGLAASLAAQFATPSDVAHLAAINEEFTRATRAGDLEQLFQLNLQFHEAIAQAARNSLLLRLMRQIHHLVRRFPGTTFQHPGRAASAAAEHAQIVEAIRNHDAERARLLASASMATARQLRIAMLEEEEHVSPS